jgi:hypothetical protein
MTFLPGIITLIIKYPPSPYSFGGMELFYDFDYFKEGGGYANIHGSNPCLERSGVSWWVCVAVRFLVFVIGSNLADIYLLGHILVSIKRQTNATAPALAPNSLERRQRYTTN